MPNNNGSQQTTDDSQQSNVTFPSVSVEDTLPPTVTTTTVTTSSAAPQDTVNPSPANSVSIDNGSAAPSNDLNISGVVGTTPPKKKFAGGKVIATILGLFLLVGGVGAGVFLTSQDQNISEKASDNYVELGGNGQYCKTAWAGCNVGSLYPGKFVAHYHCNTTDPGPNGCGDEVPGEEAVQSASFSFDCGSEQIDAGPGLGSNEFISRIYEEPCTGGGGNVACIPLINIYDSNWTKVNDPSTLPAGTNVRVGIIDRYKTSVFNKARFTVNGTLRPETSAKREVFIVGTSGPKMTVLYDNITVTTGTTDIFAEVQFGGIWYGK